MGKKGRRKRKNNIFFRGVCVDNDTGKKLHRYESNDIDDFEEMFTKTMRRKML